MEEKSQNRGGNSEKKKSYRPCSSIFEGVRSFILYAMHSTQSPSNLPHSFYPFGDNYVILQHRNVKPFIHMTQTSRIHTYTYGQIWQIAYPILLSVLMEQLIGMTDTAFLGRVGEVELGASAIGGIFYVAVFMLGMGFSVGTQILMARRNGEGRYADIGVIFYHSLAFLLAMATVLFALTRLYAPALLTRLMNSADVCHAASDFLHWRVYSFFFSFINVLFRAFYVATTNTRTLTFNSLVLVVSNFLFTYTLIFGHFGFPAYGIAGAAMGNTLAAATSTVFFIIGRMASYSPCPIRLPASVLAVEAMAMTVMKVKADMLRTRLVEANSRSPRCSTPMKKRNQVASERKSCTMVHMLTPRT